MYMCIEYEFIVKTYLTVLMFEILSSARLVALASESCTSLLTPLTFKIEFQILK